MSVGYIIKYTNRMSVGNRPEIDHQIGVDNGIIGCGRRLTDEKAFSLEWFTLINGRLYYHGKPTERVEDEDPWLAFGGQHWNTKFRVRHHLDLGPLPEVLAHIGASTLTDMNVKLSNVFMADWPASHRLIAYARACTEGEAPVTASTASTASTTHPAPAVAKSATSAVTVDTLLQKLIRLSAEVDEIYAALASRLAVA